MNTFSAVSSGKRCIKMPAFRPRSCPLSAYRDIARRIFRGHNVLCVRAGAPSFSAVLSAGQRHNARRHCTRGKTHSCAFSGVRVRQKMSAETSCQTGFYRNMVVMLLRSSLLIPFFLLTRYTTKGETNSPGRSSYSLPPLHPFRLLRGNIPLFRLHFKSFPCVTFPRVH